MDGKQTYYEVYGHEKPLFLLHGFTQSLQSIYPNLTKVWRPHELLDYSRGKTACFKPGVDVLYSNTNYILLGMIIEKVVEKPLYEGFEDRIFKPLQMNETRFAAEDPVPEGIVRGFVDFYSNFNLINSTYYSGWDYFTADGGLILNANDFNLFFHALFNEKVLSEESLNLMLYWQNPKEPPINGFKTAYGLGIFKIETESGSAYIHSRDAIGYFACMAHFPSQNITIT